MKRRTVLQTLSTVILASISAKGLTMNSKRTDSAHEGVIKSQNSLEAGRLKLGDEHFLSERNPLATADQRELETLALSIIATPEILRAREIATWRLKILTGRDATEEAWASFDSVMDEWIYHNALMAVNLDPNYPKVLRRAFAPPHEWFGLKVPGSRGFGGINPDATYTVIPIDYYARFEVTGQCFDPRPVDVQFSLSANALSTMTLANFEWQDMQINADGTFVLSLDPDPANGRANHIQSAPDACFLFIRDVRANWHEVPNAYRVKRLDAPLMPAMTFQQMVDRAARYIIEDVAGCYPFMAIVNQSEVNKANPPFATGTLGGLVTQMMSVARLKLKDDEAFVLTIDPGGAKHHVVPIVNFWGCTLNFWSRTSSLNSRQSIPNADGTTTYVISIKDPGVYNWIDPVGLTEPRLQIRWHSLADSSKSDKKPAINGKLVKLSELRKSLSEDTKWVTPAKRKQQLAERLESFQLRNFV